MRDALTYTIRAYLKARTRWTSRRRPAGFLFSWGELPQVRTKDRAKKPQSAVTAVTAGASALDDDGGRLALLLLHREVSNLPNGYGRDTCWVRM